LNSQKKRELLAIYDVRELATYEAA